ncbi:hypothetical protein DA799_11925 [Lactiplantibacillus plantarum]|uniref:phage head spike fiber domain-containing protein n=1 Tax=Lactiplantibacillus plantarum TaxID=1590 RepID=UPI000D3221A3|nr:carbohydrate binding domain-containing protein [Lactiplantibacillus plantarum]MBO2712489.1 hypothetical protein [Lactiplantibacillus plantarum]PTM30240.1 hypothetical protein DA799_11925 [Lactiplantibacillus plantarum]
MADITHGTWIKDGKAVDAAYQSGVKVYGRNLYADTLNINNPNVWNRQWTKTGEIYNGMTAVSNISDWDGLSQTLAVKAGEIYTFSLYAKYESGTGQSNLYFRGTDGKDSNNTDIMSKTVNLDETWKRVFGTFTITADGFISPRLERGNSNTNTLIVAGLKLEKGSTATPYSQAPEDISN